MMELSDLIMALRSFLHKRKGKTIDRAVMVRFEGESQDFQIKQVEGSGTWVRIILAKGDK